MLSLVSGLRCVPGLVHLVRLKGGLGIVMAWLVPASPACMSALQRLRMEYIYYPCIYDRKCAVFVPGTFGLLRGTELFGATPSNIVRPFIYWQ